MKKNLRVCCDEILKALGRGLRYVDDVDSTGEIHYGIYLVAAPGAPPLVLCPWCGEKLPFPIRVI